MSKNPSQDQLRQQLREQDPMLRDQGPDPDRMALIRRKILAESRSPSPRRISYRLFIPLAAVLLVSFLIYRHQNPTVTSLPPAEPTVLREVSSLDADQVHFTTSGGVRLIWQFRNQKSE